MKHLNLIVAFIMGLSFGAMFLVPSPNGSSSIVLWAYMGLLGCGILFFLLCLWHTLEKIFARKRDDGKVHVGPSLTSNTG